MKKVILILLIFSALGFTDSTVKKPCIVMVQYKTLPEKSAEAILHLNGLIEHVNKEEHFIQIKMYVDPNDATNILLFEEWSDEEYYKNEHMGTEHIKKFIAESRNFLAGPPEITFWKLEKTF